MILIYIAKSGSGKNYFLEKQIKCGVKPIITYTSRPIRAGEHDGVEYNFVGKEWFSNNKDKIIESRSYNTLYRGQPDIWYYGSAEVDINDGEYAAILDIDGAISYINYYGKENIEIVYVDTSAEVRRQRAKLRGGYDESEFNRRIEDDDIKFSDEAINNLIRILGKDITIINNDSAKPTMRRVSHI